MIKLLFACFVGAAVVCLSGAQEEFDRVCHNNANEYDYIEYCTECINYGVQCASCRPGQAMKTDNKSCHDCPDFCAICEWSDAFQATTCLNCTTGYYLNNGVCTICPVDKCGVCETGNRLVACDECLPGYAHHVTTFGGVNISSCVVCPAFCKSCKAVEVGGVPKGTCDSCIESYYTYKPNPSEDVKECNPCPNGCLKCTEVNGVAECSQCRASFALNSDASPSKCEPCRANCNKCTWNNQLTRTDCESGQCVSERYSINPLGECVVCQANCEKCSTHSACSTCDPYFYLTGISCSSCDANCIECTAQSCTRCGPRFVLNANPSVDKTCDVCPTFCNSCDQNGCTTCQNGYYVNAQGQCSRCSTGCRTCSSSSSCSACETSYALYNGACYACPSVGCSSTSCVYDTTIFTTKCTGCAAGYVFNTGSTVCHACPPNCLTASCMFNDTAFAGRTTYCDTAGCASGYQVTTDSLCAPCPPRCTACTLNTTINAMDCDATSCSGATFETTDAGSADVVDGVAIVQGQDYCKPCIDGCTACSTQYDVCDTCNTTHTINAANGCDRCPDNCATGCALNTTGTEEVNCATCVSGYGINAAKVACELCSSVAGAGCGTCHWDTGLTPNAWVCDGCSGAYYYNVTTKTCGACDSKCTDCSLEGAGKCNDNMCIAGYTRNSVDKRCYNCPVFCDVCSYSATPNAGDLPDLCTDCQTYYGLNQANPVDTQCTECPSNCLVCSLGASGNLECDLSQCEYGYARSADGQCHECPSNCATCDYIEAGGYTACVTCDTGYFTNNLVCSSCPPNCNTCNIQNGANKCTTCDIGYTVVDGFCQACISNCLECSQADTCNTCAPGYGKASDSRSCVLCATLTEVDQCNSCSDQQVANSPADCFSCSSGYVLADDSLACWDVSIRTTDCASYVDPPQRCLTCNAGYNVTSNGYCGTVCSFCGIYGTWRPEEECNAEGLNYTVVECVGFDTCHMVWQQLDVEGAVPEVARGCFSNVTCTEDSFEDDHEKNGYCTDVTASGVPNARRECTTCCKGANCNNYMFQGQAAIKSSIALLFAAIASVVAIKTFF